MSGKVTSSKDQTLADFIMGKSEHTIELFNYFVEEYQMIGQVTAHPAKSMIGIATHRKRIAYITQLGKNFIHVVFPFEEAHHETLCFHKIAQVPGEAKQFNHHLRVYAKEDVNKEVLGFMKLAYTLGS